jgi:hypothetical protein
VHRASHKSNPTWAGLIIWYQNWAHVEKGRMMRTSSSTITRWKRRNINGPCGPVVVGRWPCEPHYPTLLSLGGGSHIKGESHPSPNGLVFWGDWSFPWGMHRRTVLSLHRNSGAKAKLRNRCLGLTINPIPPGLDSSVHLRKTNHYRVINWSINGHYIYSMGVSTLNSRREVRGNSVFIFIFYTGYLD